ncbi:MAG: type I restriction endonuclease subunit R [Desulfobacula sp.]|jgi:type I restriction enzyme, R subunit|uniref:type I restriction endonuclease subunit R n=1 Tax=Desulfobacula sp. TaxID=2593537 RepID=UPI001D4A22DB|nr:type I restriction endonuclease subunit R [Desulfobacula sp.]MBT3806325.1 type I restriction endonuclease subunit R [Desulfobacula sp.]MBT4024257.1 type I restriction endonuclease subunit R [Desulfobacula sp.]MBT4874697.1 type I restriction endonuclease subunit R [Desulfobacula sp.]MBT5543454.1 type I restriction endonuclease subunit R [Desulfobacula sp.]
MADKSNERVFQNDIIEQLKTNGWLLGKPENYNRELALYSEDLLGFVQDTQDAQWRKFCKLYPNTPEKKFLERVASQLNKADPNAADKQMRTFGTLGVLRHDVRDRGTRFNLCQFKPEHELNPDTLARYKKNRLRVVSELVYSPWATQEHLSKTGKKAKAWRIDLVLFVNGIPVATLELKSEFKQAVHNAIKQYKTTRLPIDPVIRKPEPLLTFKRGALVHFAVSQYEVYMATRLEGDETFFLPFNKGTLDGGSGNDVPGDKNQYATDYLWNEVLLPDNLLNILARYVHLQIEEKEDWEGRKFKKETMIFPRYHQWDVVNKLITAARTEGPGHKYLIQHSAGSGKSNSIAWTAHQLSSLYDTSGNKQFNSVIVITDRTVLDDQLQDTIYQFEHVDGVVGRINKKVGEGSKSEKLAAALEISQPIIIVTIQTFPFVLQTIENNLSLKERNYAVIADEAHSSQTGTTARKLKEVLMIDTPADGEQELSTDEILDAVVASRRASSNLSYFAFTATPKTKTLELFGRLPKPDEESSKKNKPEAYHVYSMRQAIEEGFILDVLKNYTNYKVAYKIALKIKETDQEVESKKAKVKLNQWVRLHDYNIAQKVQVIIEHFKNIVMGQLAGQAKAMVVTSSRKEAVRYKKGFDKYIAQMGYQTIHSMVAFSGEVVFNENDPNVDGLLDEKFTEINMNPDLKGRDMRKAFDSGDYQVMIVANKFQTGFDQPKLCAMYVDKKLGGVECVQTLSRLNRTYPGKADSGTFILDFFNDPEDILESFQPYYQTAELADVSNPDLVFDLFDKLRASGIFLWHEVEQFCEAYLQKSKSNAAIANICKPAVERWKVRYKSAIEAYKEAKNIFERTKKQNDPILIANAENKFKECKKEKDFLEIFKKDLGTFVRFYEFMSQIVDYDNKDLEKLSIYARNLRPMLRESLIEEDDIDLGNVVLSHYRLSAIRQQDLKLEEEVEGYQLEPGEGLGTARARDRKEEFLSQIISRLNELFITDNLTNNDLVNYAYTIRDKVIENKQVMTQLANNTPEQAMLGDFPKALEDAVMGSSEVHQNQMMQLLSDPSRFAGFARMMFDMVKSVA